MDGVLSWGGLVTPKFSAPPSGETASDPQKSWRYKNVLEVLYHHAKFGGLGFHLPLGRPKRWVFVCLSVCPSRFWTSEFVHPVSPWRRWSTETILIPLDRGRFIVVHPCSTFNFSDCCQLATPLNAEVYKAAKIVFFFAAIGRQNKLIEAKFGT